MTSNRVAIVGGGLGGLCLAVILQRSNVPVVVFESELARDARSQGGSLDIHPGTGQRALRDAGLYKEFMKHVRTGGDAMMIADQHGKVLYEDKGDNSRPEIEREDLRSMLIDALEAGTIQWEHKLQRVEEPDEENGPIKLIFKGSVELARVVVGADGAWSRVRSVLTDVQPSYTGISIIDVRGIPTPTEGAYAKRGGTLFAIDDDSRVLIAHLAGDLVHAYVGVRCEQGSLKAEDLESLMDKWGPEFRSMVLAPEATRAVRPLVVLPPKTRWERPSAKSEEWRRRVTLIGDAAHVMSPFAGEGANLALADAADLAAALTAAWKRGLGLGNVLGEEVWKMIDKFEHQRMWSRATRAANESQSNLEVFFKGEGAAAVAKMFTEMFTVMNMVRMTAGAAYVAAAEFFGHYD
ncbi:hypothetical protein HK101_005890 [Irineochytrium annulatum]|nr:hypothetical protein HK101_005890 [Irineochytrium annulatum]